MTRSSRHGILVDIFFLRAVQTNDRLDGLDDALGVADQIAIGIFGAKPKGKALKKPCQMLDFPVGAAHGGKPRRIAKLSRKPRIDRSLVFAFVFDDAFLHDAVGFRDEGDSALSVRVVQGVCNFAQAIEPFSSV